MIVSIVVAVSENGVIGKDNRLVWRLPDDMKFFKETTIGHHVIMGRRNYDSIPPKFRPLKNRTNIVLTRQKGFEAPGCVVLPSLEEALDFSKGNGEEEAFVIGGGQIYREALEKNLVDMMYYTEVKGGFDGDVFFPEVDWTQWEEVEREPHLADERHSHAFDFVTYVKKN